MLGLLSNMRGAAGNKIVPQTGSEQRTGFMELETDHDVGVGHGMCVRTDFLGWKALLATSQGDDLNSFQIFQR